MVPPCLESDFFLFQEALSPRENEAVAAVRDHFDTDVRPIADE